jgi:hypothetical protein
VSLTLTFLAVRMPGAAAAPAQGDAVCAQAAALAAVWDDAVAQLHKRAAAMNVQAPLLFDLTLERAMDNSDLRMQLLTWSKLKPGVYTLLARVHSTEDMPAAPGFHFRLDDSSDVAAERREWQERLRLAKPVLERIVKHGTAAGYVEKARKLLAAMGLPVGSR